MKMGIRRPRITLSNQGAILCFDILFIFTLLLRQPIYLVFTTIIYAFLLIVFTRLSARLFDHLRLIILIGSSLVILAITISGSDEVDKYVKMQMVWICIYSVRMLLLYKDKEKEKKHILFSNNVVVAFGIINFLFWVMLILSPTFTAVVSGAMSHTRWGELSYWPLMWGYRIPRLNFIIFNTILLLGVSGNKQLLRNLLIHIPGLTTTGLMVFVIRLFKFRNILYVMLAVLLIFVFIDSELFRVISGTLSAQREISNRIRVERFPELYWFARSNSLNVLNENIYVAISQGAGLMIGILFFIVINTVIYQSSRSVNYTIISNLLMITNPVPVAMILLFADYNRKIW
jgi:hypothetical protein